jgi:hypothetical protein
MLIGYARTLTLSRRLGWRPRRGTYTPCGARRCLPNRQVLSGLEKGLEDAVEFARTGDTLVVTKLDRLARSVPHMWDITGGLQAKGVGLRIVDMGIDTSTPMGKLMLNVVFSKRALSCSIVVSVSSKRGGSTPARRAAPLFAWSATICTCRASANMSGASRHESRTDGSIFLGRGKRFRFFENRREGLEPNLENGKRVLRHRGHHCSFERGGRGNRNALRPRYPRDVPAVSSISRACGP